MKHIDDVFLVLYSELNQRSFDAVFMDDFPVGGRFVKLQRKGRYYWYFDHKDGNGGQNRKYVGPDDDVIRRQIETFNHLKNDDRSRRRIVSTLIRQAYFPRPIETTGLVIDALSRAGFFRLRGILVGTSAMQVYPGILGRRLDNAISQTQDADFAQYLSISLAVGDLTLPLKDALQSVDPSFRALPHQSDGRLSTSFINNVGYKVEFITPNMGSDDQTGKPIKLPALGIHAEPLRFLDYLLHNPVRGVILFGSGIPVMVPAPERFAVHKLIVASRRRENGIGLEKIVKDRQQASAILSAMFDARENAVVAEAYIEAIERGPAWRDAIFKSLLSYKPKERELIEEGLTTGIAQLALKPTNYLPGQDVLRVNRGPSP